jgi:phosphatidylethanolamine-binding protein (PEBP) family uncharacterized protein
MQLVINNQNISGETISIDDAQSRLYIAAKPIYKITIIRDVSLSPEFIHMFEQTNMSTGQQQFLLPYHTPHPPTSTTHKYVVEIYVTSMPLPNLEFQSRRFNVSGLIRQYRMCLVDSDYFFVSN